MTKRLDGTVTLVTGASSGIGECTALALAEEGAAVALVARRRDRLEALAGRIGSAGTTLVIEADITDRAQAERAVATTVAELGRLDTLVNNAGVMLLGPIVGAPVEEWERMVHLDLLGLLYCTRGAATPALGGGLRAPRGGRRGQRELGRRPGGAAQQRGLQRHQARRGRVQRVPASGSHARHVRITLIEPGATATELAFHNRPEILEGMAQNFAGIEIMLAEDIAEAIRYAVTQPRRVAVNEILVRPTEQER